MDEPHGDSSRTWSTRLPDGRWGCTLCPRRCRLRIGQRGFCVVREANEGGIALSTWGRAVSFSAAPVENLGLYHFRPRALALTCTTLGTNMPARTCGLDPVRTSDQRAHSLLRAHPRDLAASAERHGCEAVAFHDSEPVVQAEYVLDVARVCRAGGLALVATTSGFLTPEARPAFLGALDAVRLDLVAVDPGVHRRLCLSDLEPMLDTVEWAVHHSSAWVEVVAPLGPRSTCEESVRALCSWLLDHVGPDVPLHLKPLGTELLGCGPPATAMQLLQAREQALSMGLRWVYTPHHIDPVGGSTFCRDCGGLLVWREVRHTRVPGACPGTCAGCGARMPGVF